VHLLFFEKIVHLFFLKSLSFSLFFCQIFSSQIISKTRKTCRRTKGNLLALLQESPQVFGIARLSEVRTIQISHKKNPILWVEKAEKQQIRDSCALYLYIYIYIYIYLVWLNFYKYPRETIKTIRTAKYIYIYIYIYMLTFCINFSRRIQILLYYKAMQCYLFLYFYYSHYYLYVFIHLIIHLYTII